MAFPGSSSGHARAARAWRIAVETSTIAVQKSVYVKSIRVDGKGGGKTRDGWERGSSIPFPGLSSKGQVRA